MAILKSKNEKVKFLRAGHMEIEVLYVLFNGLDIMPDLAGS